MKKSHKKLEIVLLAGVEKLGEKGEKIEVAKGYAVNYLFPTNLAVISDDPKAVALIKQAEKEKEKKQKEIDKASQLAEKITGLNIKILTKTAKGDKLFGSITKKDILKEIEKNAKVKLEKAEIISPKMPIKKIGNYELKIKLASDIESKINLKVSAKNNKKKRR